MGTERNRIGIDCQLHDEAIASKKRVREQLKMMIEETSAEPDYTIDSEWIDMSPSGEFEAILA